MKTGFWEIKNNWELTEVWIDSMLSPPYILLLLCDKEGNCQVYDPKQGNKVVFSSNNYEAAKLWLLEDEYEPFEGRLLAAELV
ncbi:hypothetical protein [Sphaerospermopsis sp. LEGE 08334]|jgi:hypothetical protein|uniref:hypothetical protein n=1 Tax=Sphaerospermopsis sp. LEGE 08334 TaxID=1828651 RepID=UPI001881C895|nr:hypothetical protein [Sphaerospermopsis sp. LEGE 08334]MBE9057526.1 hypothetical protein [Sphaerospermopsis sp. LEGE 08334]